MGGSRLSASPPSAQAGLSCGMCPTTFAVERGTFDLPPDRAGDVPRRGKRDRLKRWKLQPITTQQSSGLAMWKGTIERTGRKMVSLYTLGLLT